MTHDSHPSPATGPISTATARNWARLQSDAAGKLAHRANKRLSGRQVAALGYLHAPKARMLLESVRHAPYPIADIIYTLCVDRLKHCGIYGRPGVAEALADYAGVQTVPIGVPEGLWDTPADVLGFVYQSLQPEGLRNALGLYYTHADVARYLLAGITLAPGERLLDPCCGSGSFLVGAGAPHPEQLYGTDIDPVAVLIARTNLLCAYPQHDFVPHVFRADFLTASRLFGPAATLLPQSFRYICSNPPWGADKERKYAADFPMVKSKERASMFLVEAMRHLQPGGRLIFLLPTSLLKIKAHADIRGFILRNSTIQAVHLFSNRFDGVYTDFFGLDIVKAHTDAPRYVLRDGNESHTIALSSTDMARHNIVFRALSEVERSIIGKVESRGCHTLADSKWALGIVTGNNKQKLSATPRPGMEPVYKGKQVRAFTLDEAEAYIKFDPKQLQQCAPEACYRAPEKLIYRFIAKYPVVAYDDQQRLCLNSANILIPRIEGLSVPTVAALLNSRLYRFYYQSLFHDIKVLKGNLMQLPFPHLEKEQDAHIRQVVAAIVAHRAGPGDVEALNEYICNLFGLNDEERHFVKEALSKQDFPIITLPQMMQTPASRPC